GEGADAALRAGGEDPAVADGLVQGAVVAAGVEELLVGRERGRVGGVEGDDQEGEVLADGVVEVAQARVQALEGEVADDGAVVVDEGEEAGLAAEDVGDAEGLAGGVREDDGGLGGLAET